MSTHILPESTNSDFDEFRPDICQLEQLGQIPSNLAQARSILGPSSAKFGPILAKFGPIPRNAFPTHLADQTPQPPPRAMDDRFGLLATRCANCSGVRQSWCLEGHLQASISADREGQRAASARNRELRLRRIEKRQLHQCSSKSALCEVESGRTFVRSTSEPGSRCLAGMPWRADPAAVAAVTPWESLWYLVRARTRATDHAAVAGALLGRARAAGPVATAGGLRDAGLEFDGARLRAADKESAVSLGPDPPLLGRRAATPPPPHCSTPPLQRERDTPCGRHKVWSEQWARNPPKKGGPSHTICGLEPAAHTKESSRLRDAHRCHR